jgi:cyclophilin family peptidyl-prolyl cis-trans isomerase
MNQTTWIVGGGVIIVAVAVMFYFFSGDGIPKKAVPSPIVVNPETMLAPATTTGDTSEPTPTPVAEAPKVPETTPAPKAEVAPAPTPSPVANEVLLKTSMGNITLKLYRNDAPKTVENFTKLAKEGFYNGVRFHRVIKDFMIQTGDPLSKDDTKQGSWGTGGPGYQFPDEINAQSPIYQRGYKRGVLAMANSGPNTNGSQFFIMHRDNPLPSLYTIFGEVVSGQDVVDAIAATAVTKPGDRPVAPVTIISVEVK